MFTVLGRLRTSPLECSQPICSPSVSCANYLHQRACFFAGNRYCLIILCRKKIYNRTLGWVKYLEELEGIATKLDSRKTGRGRAGRPHTHTEATDWTHSLFGHSLGASKSRSPLLLDPQEAASWTLKHWFNLYFHKGFSTLRKPVSSHWTLMPEQSSLHQCLPIAVVNTAGKLLLLLFHLLNLVHRCMELDNPHLHLSSPCYEEGTPEGSLSGYQGPALRLESYFLGSLSFYK